MLNTRWGVKCSILQNEERVYSSYSQYPLDIVRGRSEELHHKDSRGRSSKHKQWVSVVVAGGPIDRGLIRKFDSRGGSGRVRGIDIGSDIVRRFNGVVAGDINRTYERVEMAGRNIVGIIPIDHAPRPLNGALRGSLDASGPYADLDPSGGRWVENHSVGIYGVRLLQGADYVPVNQPRQGIGLPVDCVVMVVAEGVGKIPSGETVGLGRNETLPEVVCLSLSCICTRPFPIDFIPDGGHGDERSYHPTPSPGFYSCGHGSIVKVASGGNPTSAIIFGQQESEFSSARVGVKHVTHVQGPVPFSGIPVEVCSVRENARVIGEGMLRTFADWVWQARIERMGVQWVTAA